MCIKRKYLFTNCTILHGFRWILQFFDWVFCNNRQSLHQHLKLLWCNLHGFFLCTRSAKTADVQSFIKKQESITFPNEPFNSIGAFSTEQEQNMLLKRIQIKLKLNARCQTVNSTSQVSIPCGNKNFFKSDSIVKHGEDLQPYLEVLP